MELRDHDRALTDGSDQHLRGRSISEATFPRDGAHELREGAAAGGQERRVERRHERQPEQHDDVRRQSRETARGSQLVVTNHALLAIDALHGLPIDIEASDLPPLPAAVEVAAYRIVVEALTNVVRHSTATQAAVTLLVHNDSLEIAVSDNGTVGGEWVPGIGLISMSERAGELGGTIRYHTNPTGSTVTATLPLRTTAEQTPTPADTPQYPCPGR